MKPLCSSCSLLGREKLGGMGLTLEECKKLCMDDETCLGINFGNSLKCTLNIQQNEKYSKSTYFDAWRKDPECVKAMARTSSPGFIKKLTSHIIINVLKNIQFTLSISFDFCLYLHGIFDYLANGNWGSWETWQDCSVTCGKGYKVRNRQCNYPPPCHGRFQQRRECILWNDILCQTGRLISLSYQILTSAKKKCT